MLYILHGDNQKDSRLALNKLIDDFHHTNVLRLDYKQANLETINNFLQGTSLFSSSKTLLIDNFFSGTKDRNKLVALIKKSSSNSNIILWQTKKLTPSQIKLFPQAKIQLFTLPNFLWGCINAVSPGNLKNFLQLYQKIIDQNLYDLFLYLLKNHLRKQITAYSRFPQPKLIKTYLQLIELDYQNKSGQLATPKEIALERIIVRLLQS